MNPAAMAPRQPPALFPKIPMTLPSKYIMIGDGKTITGEWKIMVKNVTKIQPTVEPKKPNIPPIGEYGKIVGASNAGIAPGKNLSEIPLKAGTIEPINIRTPWSKITIPAVKANPCKINQRIQFVASAELPIND